MHTPMLTTDFFDRAVDVYDDVVGVVAHDGREYTYGEFEDRVNRLAHGLANLGLEYGDRVAIISPNTHWFLECLYAVTQLGFVFVPLNYRLTDRDYAYLLGDCGADVLIVDHEHIEQVMDETGDVPTSHQYVYDPDGTCDTGWPTYDDLLSDDTTRPHRPTIDEDDPATILYTSGTTGDPKGVVHTHRTQHWHALVLTHHTEIHDDDTMLWTFPMFHVNGWGHVYSITGVGGTHVCQRYFDSEGVFDRLEEYDVSLMGGAPATLKLLREQYDAAGISLDDDRHIRFQVAGSPPSRSLLEFTEEVLGWKVLQSYGLTETGPLTATSNSARRTTDANRHTIKKKQGAAALGTKLRVVDEDGNDVPPDDESPGEVVTKGNNVMKGYWEDPERTHLAFNDRESGWFHTGDIATIDEFGMITVRDRKKDIIVSGGENISSIEVEDVLHSHPDVEETAVIGVPSERWGEEVKALVVPRTTGAATGEDLIEHCRDRLANYKCPKSVDFADSLPRNATGKVQKHELRSRYRE